jgi:hypothetical protein
MHMSVGGARYYLRLAAECETERRKLTNSAQ